MERLQILRRIAIHVVAWAFVLSIPFLLRPDNPGRPMPHTPVSDYNRELFFQFQNALLIAFFYLNYLLLVPRLLIRRRWVYIAFVLLCFVVFQVLLTIFYGYTIGDQGMPGERFYQRFGFMAAIFLFGLSWAASSGIRLNEEWKKADDRQRESENARLNAELLQLKSQLNPHFLFNTLNGIYTLALAKDDHAPDAVMKLSHLLRYVTAQTNSDFVPLASDLEHLRHFIDLHRMRLTEQTPVHFNVEGSVAGQQIAPLLLLPFVENAFKFGSSAREHSPIDISLKIEGNQLRFSCRNHLRNRNDDSTGIGIANTKRRLELLYPERYLLDISENEGVFEVNLKIDLTKTATL